MYGTEAFYNITENEMRQIEIIEESQMREIFGKKTGIKVSTHLIILELGQIPARFVIKRRKLNYYQKILHTDRSSPRHSMLAAQMKHPTKGDWYSECVQILHEFNIHLTSEEIRSMKSNKFKNIVKARSHEAAHKYLHVKLRKGKRGP